MLYCNQLGETEEKEVEKQDRREALDVAALAGDILLASGAEIFRVEETIFRIARAYGVESSDAFVLSSGIFLTAGSDRERQDLSGMRAWNGGSQTVPDSQVHPSAGSAGGV